VETPPEIDGELLGLRTRQKHTKLKSPQELGFVDPSSFIDYLGLEDRDLTRWPTEADTADL